MNFVTLLSFQRDVAYKCLLFAIPVAKTLFPFVFYICTIPEDIPLFIPSVESFTLQAYTSWNHPQFNGQAEHPIQELHRFLWAYCHS